MTQLLEKMRETELLGREFLLWLWFKSDVNEGRFSLGEAGEAEVCFDRRVVLQSQGDEGTEKVVCSGENPHLREARFALTEKKAVTEAMLKLIIGDDEWSFTLDSQWMNFKSFKSPRVMQDFEEDPDGLFYEKFALIDKALSAVDRIYSSFIKERVSPDWEKKELPALNQWIRQGK